MHRQYDQFVEMEINKDLGEINNGMIELLDLVIY